MSNQIKQNSMKLITKLIITFIYNKYNNYYFYFLKLFVISIECNFIITSSPLQLQRI